MPAPNSALPPIHVVRGQRVMLDSDLAWLYGIATKVFNQGLQRNADRFPRDFAFQITREELTNLKSQIVTSSLAVSPSVFGGYGGTRKLPWVFTEHGAIMAATILRSPRAVTLSVYVIRAFVQMRDALLTNAVVLKRLAQIDKKALAVAKALICCTRRCVLPARPQTPEAITAAGM